jgi:Family of unknown function (DUF6804)
MKHIAGLYIVWAIATVMLAIAVARPAEVRGTYARRADHYYQSRHRSHASDFYTLLRWVCCAAFAYSAVTALRMKRIPWTWIFGILAVLFNPLAPVYLQRATWQIIDWATIAVIVIAAITFWRPSSKPPPAPSEEKIKS